MVEVRWTGLGCLAFVVWVFAACTCILVAFAVFPPLVQQFPALAQPDGGEQPLGVLLGGVAAGVTVSGVLNYLLGLALNLRRLDGEWYFTGYHTIYGTPVERFGVLFVVGGILLLPFAMVGFVPMRTVWWTFAAWAVVVLAVTFTIAVRYEERQKRARATGSADARRMGRR
jgi:hypothetical protein